MRIKFKIGQEYFAQRILDTARFFKEEIKLFYTPHTIYLESSEEFLKRLEGEIFNSLFFEGVEVVKELEGEEFKKTIPFNLFLCPRCLKEMVEPSSRRYFYPFTMCNSCGTQAQLLFSYPYNRENSLLSIFRPCPDCIAEKESNPFRKDFELISCTQCNIPIKLTGKNKEFYANESSEYKQIFKLLAKAIQQGEKVVIKTFRGYKRFFKNYHPNAKALLLKPSTLFNCDPAALFSIERPFLYLASKEDVEGVGAYDGFTFLLLVALGEDVIYFDEEIKDYSLKCDFDLTPSFYPSPKLFIHKGKKLFKEIPYPVRVSSKKVVLFGELLQYEGVIDKVEKFKEVTASTIYTFKKEPIEHNNIVQLDLGKVYTNCLLQNQKEIASLYFTSLPRFYIANSNQVKEVFRFKEVEFKGVKKVSLKFKEKFPNRFEKFLEEKDFLIKAGKLLGVDSFEELNLLSMRYKGKGGLSIDCRLVDKNFDYESFYSSIMSFIIAEAKEELIAYSIFESLGDFFSTQLLTLPPAQKAIFGEYMANKPFLDKLKIKDFSYPRRFPIDRVVEF
ncbi:MAG: hypothetical protein GXO61_03215 [Epsilonproteobacteria bacterium]|nr:hypothetical protein [Campylobacterota bacterium]